MTEYAFARNSFVAHGVAEQQCVRAVDRFAGTENERRLDESFMVPMDDGYGCYVGRSDEHGIGVSCPWWPDVESFEDPDAVPSWVTVYQDGTVEHS